MPFIMIVPTTMFTLRVTINTPGITAQTEPTPTATIKINTKLIGPGSLSQPPNAPANRAAT
jgi:hypothetical protein